MHLYLFGLLMYRWNWAVVLVLIWLLGVAAGCKHRH